MARSQRGIDDDFEPVGFSQKFHRNAGIPEYSRDEAMNLERDALVKQLDALKSVQALQGNKGGPLGVQKGFERQADSSSAMFFNTQMSDVIRTPLLYVDPLWDTVLLLFPEDNLKEVNKRLRHYYKYHPYVGNIIDIHSEFPLSDF